MGNFIEIQNLGLNFSTLIFLVTVFLTLLQAVALVKQSNRIVKKRSGESVSFVFFSYYSFSSLAIIAYGLFIHSLALVISGFLGFLSLIIIINLLRFKKNSSLEKNIGLGSSVTVLLIIFMSQKDWLFLFFGLIMMLSVSLQIKEMWKNKSSGSIHLAQIIVGFLSCFVWFFYALVIDIWPLKIINLVGLVSWFVALLSYLKFREFLQSKTNFINNK